MRGYILFSRSLTLRPRSRNPFGLEVESPLLMRQRLIVLPELQFGLPGAFQKLPRSSRYGKSGLGKPCHIQTQDLLEESRLQAFREWCSLSRFGSKASPEVRLLLLECGVLSYGQVRHRSSDSMRRSLKATRPCSFAPLARALRSEQNQTPDATLPSLPPSLAHFVTPCLS